MHARSAVAVLLALPASTSLPALALPPQFLPSCTSPVRLLLPTTTLLSTTLQLLSHSLPPPASRLAASPASAVHEELPAAMHLPPSAPRTNMPLHTPPNYVPASAPL